MLGLLLKAKYITKKIVNGKPVYTYGVKEGKSSNAKMIEHHKNKMQVAKEMKQKGNEGFHKQEMEKYQALANKKKEKPAKATTAKGASTEEIKQLEQKLKDLKAGKYKSGMEFQIPKIEARLKELGAGSSEKKTSTSKGVKIGSEYMYKGAERKVTGKDDQGNLIIQEIDEKGKLGKKSTVSESSFLKEASKF